MVTDSDLIALSMLGIRVTGYEALIITRYRSQEIENLLGSIPAQARIDDEASGALLTRDGPAWMLWKLLYEIKDRTKDARFGASPPTSCLPASVQALSLSKTAGLPPCLAEPHLTATRAGGRDVRTAALDSKLTADGTTFFRGYLAGLRSKAGVDDLPILRVLDIIGWMHARP